MNLSRALRFMFLDPTWPRRFALAFVLLALPGLIGTVLYESWDSSARFLIVVLAGLAQVAGGVYLYYFYYRITRTLALEGRDLPLPEREPVFDTGWRAIRFVVFGVVLALTMIPLLCVLGCAFVGVAMALDSAGGVIIGLLIFAFVMLTAGLAVFTYGTVATTRYLATDDFGGSLNPAEVVRLFRENPGGWLLAAFFPIALSIAVSIVRAIVDAGLVGDDRTETILSSAISSPAGMYIVLVGFHLAGQAYRLARVTSGAPYLPTPQSQAF